MSKLAMRSKLRLGLKVRVNTTTSYGADGIVGKLATVIQIDPDDNSFLVSTLTKEPHLGVDICSPRNGGEGWVRLDDNYKIYAFDHYAEALQSRTRVRVISVSGIFNCRKDAIGHITKLKTGQDTLLNIGREAPIGDNKTSVNYVASNLEIIDFQDYAEKLKGYIGS